MSIIAAMEGIDNAEGAVADETELAAAQTDVAAAEATAEATAGEADLTTEFDNVDAAVEAGDELQDYAEVAQTAVESGEGLSEDAAAAITIATERICNKLFGAGSKRIVPAKESFGQTNTRLASTVRVVESIGETLERIWIGIKNFAKRIADKVVSMISAVLGSSKMTAKQIENLRERVRKVPSDHVQLEKTLKSDSLVKAIRVDGKADASSYAKIASDAKALTSLADEVSVERAKLLASMLPLAAMPAAQLDEAAMKNFLAAGGHFDQAISGFVSKTWTVLNVGGLVNKKKATNKGKTTYHGYFVGSTTIEMSEESRPDGSTDTTLSFTTWAGKNTKELDGAAALSTAEMLKVLDVAEDLTDSMNEYKKVEGKLKNISSDVEKAAEGILKNIKGAVSDRGASGATNRAMTKMQRTASESLSFVKMIAAQSTGIMNRTAQAGVNYVSLSLKNMGKKS